MFNVKFYSFHENGEESTTAISCPHYSVYKRKNGSFEVVTYKDMTNRDGVSRNVMSNEQAVTNGLVRASYDLCYIENAQGKTVEHLNPTKDQK